MSMPVIAEPGLEDGERDALLASLARDGYCVLPMLLPEPLLQRCIAAVDRIAEARRRENGSAPSTAVKVMNCVDADPAFLELLRFRPALQLSCDVFGPMFHLCQSNVISRPWEVTTTADFTTSSPWHADGPRPGLFPAVDGAMALHYLKFGYFFTDLRQGNGGSLQIVRGSHRRPELDAVPHASFDIEAHAADVVTFDCAPGTVVAFHQALWHAAPPNRATRERKTAYMSYCPTWMRPLDREPLARGEGVQHDPVERWLLGEWRPAQRWWFPNEEDLSRMAPFGRSAGSPAGTTLHYD